jgi:antibiotic biosynthesis monooxygenase (ABM) superfamily enzyme
MTARPSEDGPVTIVIQTRARLGQDHAFAQWESRINAVVAEQPGFIDLSVVPPNPPAQPDWLVLLRFKDMAAATGWLRSDRRRSLLVELQPMLIGVHDVHLLRDPQSRTPPVCAVITMRVRPDRVPDFRDWQERLVVAETRYPGFQGYRFEQPLPGIQDDWLAILRFDTEDNLQRWLDSPERQTLLREAEDFVEDTHLRVARTGFEPWFAGTDTRAQMPPAWKQTMVVLLALYPIAFLFGCFVQRPLLLGRAGMPFWSAVFISNTVSVVLLSVLIPWTGRRLGWWLRPRLWHRTRTNILGTLLVLGLYLLMLGLFFLISI